MGRIGDRSPRVGGPMTQAIRRVGGHTVGMNATTHPNGVIVVGVDGSDGSRRALEWALDEAQRRSCAVEAVTAWPARGMSTELTEEQAANARRQADETQRHLVDSTLRRHPDAPPVSFELVRGDAVEVLVHVSGRAQLLVIGSHGVSSVRHAGLGSVSEACAQLAACPVVVLPMPVATEAATDELAVS